MQLTNSSCAVRGPGVNVCPALCDSSV